MGAKEREELPPTQIGRALQELGITWIPAHRVTNDYTFAWDAKIYQIARKDVCTGLRGACVRVEKRRDGSVAARFRDRYPREQPPRAEARPSVSERRHYVRAKRSSNSESVTKTTPL